jgi:hypothetical protein
MSITKSAQATEQLDRIKSTRDSERRITEKTNPAKTGEGLLN